WSASGATLFWQGTYRQMTYVFTFTPAAGSGGARIVFQSTVIASGWSLEGKTAATDYVPFAGTIENISEVEYTFRLVTDAATIQGQVTELTLVVAADDLVETFANFATAATTGTRLTLTQTYRAITKVLATVRTFGAEVAFTMVAVDHQATAGASNGPLMRAYGQAGTVVAGHGDVEVTGF